MGLSAGPTLTSGMTPDDVQALLRKKGLGNLWQGPGAGDTGDTGATVAPDDIAPETTTPNPQPPPAPVQDKYGEVIAPNPADQPGQGPPPRNYQGELNDLEHPTVKHRLLQAAIAAAPAIIGGLAGSRGGVARLGGAEASEDVATTQHAHEEAQKQSLIQRIQEQNKLQTEENLRKATLATNAAIWAGRNQQSGQNVAARVAGAQGVADTNAGARQDVATTLAGARTGVANINAGAGAAHNQTLLDIAGGRNKTAITVGAGHDKARIEAPNGPMMITPGGVAQRLTPGMQVEPGTRSATADLKGPTADEQRRSDLATNMGANLDKLEDIVNRRPDLFGRVAGRVSRARGAVGTNDQDIASLKAISEYLGMASVGAHSMRNAQHVETAANAVINGLVNSPEATKAAINAARGSIKTFISDAGNNPLLQRAQAAGQPGGVAPGAHPQAPVTAPGNQQPAVTHRYDPKTGRIVPVTGGQ